MLWALFAILQSSLHTHESEPFYTSSRIGTNHTFRAMPHASIGMHSEMGMFHNQSRLSLIILSYILCSGFVVNARVDFMQDLYSGTQSHEYVSESAL